MTIMTIRLRLKSLQEAIPGMTKAYATLPRGVVQAAELPLCINFVRESTYDKDVMGDNDIVIARNFTSWLMVKPAAEGEDGENETITEPWIETYVNYFMARPSLGNLVGILDSYIASDSGPKKLAWPGSPASPVGTYWGIEFRHKVVEVVQRIFASSE